MIMARKKKRGPTLEDKYLGPEPSYGPHNIIGEGAFGKVYNGYDPKNFPSINFAKA